MSLLLLLFLGLAAAKDSFKYTDPKAYLASCRAANSADSDGGSVTSKCNSFRCLTRHHAIDLRQLDRMTCRKTSDCGDPSVGLVCVHYDSGGAFCECNRRSAFNVTSCSCQTVAPCPENVSSNMCYNGLACKLPGCPCTDLENTLYVAQGRFCVLPSSGDDGDAWGVTDGETARRNQVLGIVLGTLVAMALIAVAAYALITDVKLLTMICGCCDRGEYECDDQKDGEDREEHHVTAWDLPSMDYLSEEQTMKYLRTHHRHQHPDENCSGEGGSLPESERDHENAERVNVAYVHDDGEHPRDV